MNMLMWKLMKRCSPKMKMAMKIPVAAATVGGGLAGRSWRCGGPRRH
jgi:hypothetical protein